MQCNDGKTHRKLDILKKIWCGAVVATSIGAWSVKWRVLASSCGQKLEGVLVGECLDTLRALPFDQATKARKEEKQLLDAVWSRSWKVSRGSDQQWSVDPVRTQTEAGQRVMV